MLWFNRSERKKKMEFVQNYIPTSKAQLLQVAMYFNKGDIGKAQEMFDFYAKNLDLPDFDPVSPSFLQQMKTGASDLFSWFKQNQGDIAQGYEFIRSIVSNKGLAVAEPMTEEVLPEIN